MLGYVPSNLQVTFAQFKAIFCYFRFQSQISAEIPPFLIQFLFCRPCEKAAPYPGEVGSCGQMKSRLIQLYFFWPEESSSLPLHSGPLWVPAGLLCPSLAWQTVSACWVSHETSLPLVMAKELKTTPKDQKLDTLKNWPGWVIPHVQELGIVLAVCVSLYRKKKKRQRNMSKKELLCSKLLGLFLWKVLKMLTWEAEGNVSRAHPKLICVSVVRRHCRGEDDDFVPAQGILSTKWVLRFWV